MAFPDYSYREFEAYSVVWVSYGRVFDFLIQENSNFDSQLVSASLKEWSSRKAALFPLNHIELAIWHLKNYRSELYSL